MDAPGKSINAKAAEKRGEFPWTRWTLGELIDQVLRVNSKGLTAADLRRVRCLEYLKVKLLTQTEHHHMKDKYGESREVLYWCIDRREARKLTRRNIDYLISRKPTPAELDRAVLQKTDNRYWRNHYRS